MNENNEIFFSRTNLGDVLEAGSSSDVNDIWDDALLIKTYEKATKIAMESCLEKESANNDKCKKSKKKEKNAIKWKIGDQCCCPYSEDGNLYEADIINLDFSNGTCTVKYIGYNNEEDIPLKLLKISRGESYRVQQIQDAANDNNENCTTYECYPSEDSHSIKDKMTKKKKNYYRVRSHAMEPGDSFTTPPGPVPNLVPPPPPPPHLFKNICEDREETEAMSAMLIAWYMSGYHTGYYQGLKMGKKKTLGS